MKKAVAILLLILALAMIYLGISQAMLPPTLTGIGFLAIGVVFLREKTVG